MSTHHDAVAALPISAPASQTLLRNLVTARMPYVLADADNPTDLVAVDPTTGSAIVDIAYLGRVFHYDPTDSTTANDGVTCLVSNEGRRYKLATGTDVAVWAVLSKDVTAPPGSPSNGDSYLVPSGATGAWSGHANQVAVKTARGWEFVTFGIGRLLYIEDIDTYYRRNAGGVWTAGLGNSSLANDSVTLLNVLGTDASFEIKVENQTTTVPPSSPTAGTSYIVGPSATGSWSGQDGKLAMCLVNGAFTIFAPVAGDIVYDKAKAAPYRFNGSAWISALGAIIDTATDASYTSIQTLSGTMSATSTVPSISQGDALLSLNFTMKSTTNKLRCRFTSMVAGSTANTLVTAALFRSPNSAALAAAGVTLPANGAGVLLNFEHEFVPGTTSQITMVVRTGINTSSYSFNNFYTGVSRPRLVLEEIIG